MVNTSYHSDVQNRTANHGQIKSVQTWKTKKSAITGAIEKPLSPAQTDILANLDKAAQGKVGTFDVQLKTGLGYTNAQDTVSSSGTPPSTEGFQFQDVIDVVNPLQHIPVVSMVYRGITGDKLHPMSQIIGGAIYGGPVGAVAGTVNAISQVQTGRDLGDHALNMVGIHGRQPHDDSYSAPPEIKLNNVAEKLETKQPLEDLPGTAIAFVNLSEPNRGYEYISMAEGRTAGKMAIKNANFNLSNSASENDSTKIAMNNIANVNLDQLPEREAITSVGLSALPPRKDV